MGEKKFLKNFFITTSSLCFWEAILQQFVSSSFHEGAHSVSAYRRVWLMSHVVRLGIASWASRSGTVLHYVPLLNLKLPRPVLFFSQYPLPACVLCFLCIGYAHTKLVIIAVHVWLPRGANDVEDVFCIPSLFNLLSVHWPFLKMPLAVPTSDSLVVRLMPR